MNAYQLNQRMAVHPDLAEHPPLVIRIRPPPAESFQDSVSWKRAEVS
jgi:hypothetical protein